MLRQLTIKNFGLIDTLSLEFHDQFNILTGETGAGKSIIIDALRILLGDRISASQLRNPKTACILEAVFELSSPELKSLEIFQDFLSDDDASLIIQRTTTEQARTKIKINGLSVTLGQLKEIGNNLIDFHGPHDHQMLLSNDSHKGMLDRLVNFNKLLPEYQEKYKAYSALQSKLEKLLSLNTSRERELDLLAHQIKELEQVPLEESKYEEILCEQTKVNNAEKLNEQIHQITALLEGENNGPGERIRQSFSPMRALNNIDEQTLPFMESLTQLQEMHTDLSAQLNNYAEGLSFNPEEANAINTQCDMYEDIKRKYGPTLEEAAQFYEAAKDKHNLLTNFEQEDSDLRARIQTSEKELKKIAQKITKQRQKAADHLKTTIEKELSELGIANVKFEVRLQQGPLLADGQDTVTFYISPNVGEDLKPLAEIVSSGEAARVMLALKKALIKVDPIPVLIFDEIDAQIGGRLGTITGQKLREISYNRQVILITHLPQIASFANAHFKVVKSVENKRTMTRVNFLNKKKRVQEIAKMMSGEEESAISIKHATDMLTQAHTQ